LHRRIRPTFLFHDQVLLQHVVERGMALWQYQVIVPVQ